MKLRMLVEFYNEVRLVVIYFCFFEGVKVCKYGDFIGYVIEYYLEVLMRWWSDGFFVKFLVIVKIGCEVRKIIV